MNWKVLLEQESELLIIIYLQAIKPSTICHQAVPAMISKIISNISCDKECFIKGSPDYKKALKSSQKISNSHHKLLILWFNSIYG